MASGSQGTGSTMESDFDITAWDDGNDTLVQLRRLAILYHSRGRIKEAQEIHQLILQISNTRFERECKRSDEA
jgi:hypothetical protein